MKGTYLLMALDLGVDKSPQDVRCERQVDVHQLSLLVQAVEREVITQLHCQNCILLLGSWGGGGETPGEHLRGLRKA